MFFCPVLVQSVFLCGEQLGGLDKRNSVLLIATLGNSYLNLVLCFLLPFQFQAVFSDHAHKKMESDHIPKFVHEVTLGRSVHVF